MILWQGQLALVQYVKIQVASKVNWGIAIHFPVRFSASTQ